MFRVSDVVPAVTELEVAHNSRKSEISAMNPYQPVVLVFAAKVDEACTCLTAVVNDTRNFKNKKGCVDEFGGKDFDGNFTGIGFAGDDVKVGHDLSCDVNRLSVFR